MAFPTLWDCSLLVSDAELLAEVLLEDEDPICLATLPPELPVDEEDSPTDEDELLTDDDLSEEERLTEDELLTEEDNLSEDELLTVVPLLLLLLSCEPRETLVEDLRLLSWELLDTLEPLLRLSSWELLDTEEPELLVADEPELLVEDEPELLEEEELLDEDLVWEEVVVLLDPEDRLSCEYESTGDAIRANATADAIAMFRMFFILIRC